MKNKVLTEIEISKLYCRRQNTYRILSATLMEKAQLILILNFVRTMQLGCRLILFTLETRYSSEIRL